MQFYDCILCMLVLYLPFVILMNNKLIGIQHPQLWKTKKLLMYNKIIGGKF